MNESMSTRDQHSISNLQVPSVSDGFYLNAPKVIWRGRWLVLGVTFLLTSAAGISALVIEKMYKASTVISVVSNDSNAGGLGGASSLVSQFGGLASLMGVSVSGNERKAESLATLSSELLIGKFIEQNNLLPVLYYKKWDIGNERWITKDVEKIPTLWEANEKFRKKVSRLSTDLKSGLSTLTVSWHDPVVAAKWSNDLVALANEYLRNKTILEAERNIEYLNGQLSKTNVVAVQNSIASLLETEIKRVMLAKGNDEYAFRVVDPAVPPEKPTQPDTVVWVLLGFLIGFSCSTGYLLVRSI